MTELTAMTIGTNAQLSIGERWIDQKDHVSISIARDEHGTNKANRTAFSYRETTAPAGIIRPMHSRRMGGLDMTEASSAAASPGQGEARHSQPGCGKTVWIERIAARIGGVRGVQRMGLVFDLVSLHTQLPGKSPALFDGHEIESSGETVRGGADDSRRFTPAHEDQCSLVPKIGMLNKSAQVKTASESERIKRGTRRRVSIAPTFSGGTRDRVQSRDRLTRHPNAGQ
ncbi:hypothetical protein [Bradyrhizobium sp. SZCCHNR3015]|uniref:hypothetical protein n=1 Tax=Bradyrhizobium sp. SZCCHNR3015 TaxID=3057395 RepID=UPI00291660FB|nr:hypothetical protein [Bradyrhizobium sp. SZCCHNR3015]